jgi:hypothetical protein
MNYELIGLSQHDAAKLMAELGCAERLERIMRLMRAAQQAALAAVAAK